MHPRTVLHSLVVSMIALAALTAPAHAVDGVKLINQSIANNGGVTPGDDPGFPVEITRPGSYRLSGNLTVPNAHTTAILITADNVTLDLNGFAIIGPVVCSGAPVTCGPFGFGIGVATDSTVRTSVTVSNGVIRGMGWRGVDLFFGSGHRVERVHVSHNGETGILTGAATVTGNTAVLNGNTGISVRASTVSGNVSLQNGSVGIFASEGSTVVGNTVRSNGGVGLNLATTTGYVHNVLTFNNGGNASPQVSGGIQMGPNVCRTSTFCP